MKNLILLLFSLNFVISYAQVNQNNSEKVKLYFEEVINKKKLELLNEVFADTFLVHPLINGPEQKNTSISQKIFLESLFVSFPDIHYSIGDIITEGDKVAVRVSITATHKGEFWGYAPLGNRLNNLSEIFFYRFNNGKIVESWFQLDLFNLNKQLKGE